MKMHKKLLLFILQAALLSIHFPSFFAALNCGNGLFQCGNIGYIAYPFWGGSRQMLCGRQGFELVCYGNVPILNISSLSYRVNEIDFTKNSLQIARADLQNTRCPKVLRNTTIDPDLFGYLPESNDENVTLYFDCTTTDREKLQNQFPCDGDNSNTTYIFTTGDASSGPGFGITCSKNIFVPVNSKAAGSLKDPTASSINILLHALETGFSIQWLEDEKQIDKPYCNSEVYGSCISKSSPIYKNRACSYNRCRRDGWPRQSSCSDRIGCNYIGRSPPSAPESKDNNNRTVNGTPPVQSPSYPLERGHSPYSQPGPGSNPGYLSLPPGITVGVSHPRKSSPPVGVIVGAILGIISIFIVCIIMYCCCKRRHSLRDSDQGGSHHLENILLQHRSLAPKRYKYSEIKKITKSFNDKLGQGGYGTVYKGILRDGCLVAVKVLIETNRNGEEFINEVASISRTSHVNIVNLLGFCYDRNKRALIYEFMPNQSLDKFISSNANFQLNLEKLYKIALGVAKGLEYLHVGCNTRIVHFDIKPQNILLDEDFCPKISDFGLAKLCKKKQSILSMFGARGTIGYIAPEIFSRNFGGVSHKSDVYSYGMMVLEMIGGRNIVEIEATQSSESYFPDKMYEEVILDVTRKLEDFSIEEEDDTRRKMFLVGFWCIQTTPSDRPSMSKVVEMLEGSLQSIRIPPKPFLFSPQLTEQGLSPSFSTYVETENSAEEFS